MSRFNCSNLSVVCVRRSRLTWCLKSVRIRAAYLWMESAILKPPAIGHASISTLVGSVGGRPPNATGGATLGVGRERALASRDERDGREDGAGQEAGGDHGRVAELSVGDHDRQRPGRVGPELGGRVFLE